MKGLFFKEVWAFVTSLRLTIILLIIIAGTAVFGTVIPQNESSQFYLRFYKPSTYKLIQALSLDDMYHAWWFSATLTLFTLNLVSCTLKRLPGLLRRVARADHALDDQALQGLPLKRTFRLKRWHDETGQKISRIVLARFGKPSVYESSPAALRLFAEKGKYTRFNFYITHVGIVLIILGGILGNLGFQGFMKLVEGETSDTLVLRGTSQPLKLDFAIRCNDFELSYYPGSRRPKDYKSSLTVIDEGKEVFTKVIEVNDPLSYKGVYVYQSSYGTASGAGDVVIGVASPRTQQSGVKKYRAAVGDRIALDEAGSEVEVRAFVPDFSIGQDQQVFSRSQELRNPAVQLVLRKDDSVLSERWIFANFPEFHGAAKDDTYLFTLESFIGKEYTGLQLTRDPGVWVVWAGCFLLTAGCYLMFFTGHRRLWVKGELKQDEFIVTVAGSSNKNLQAFRQVFDKLCDELRQAGKT